MTDKSGTEYVDQQIANKTVSDPSTARRQIGQFSLQSLLAMTVLSALGLGAWRSFGFYGVGNFAVFVVIVVLNVGVAFFATKYRCPIFVGALSGAILWFAGAECITRLQQSRWFEEFFWLEDPPIVVFLGLVAGLFCGCHERLKHREICGNLRREYVCAIALVAMICFWLGWRINRTIRQQLVVAHVLKSRGSVRYDYETGEHGWLRKYFAIGFFDDVVMVDGGQMTDVTPLVALKRLQSLDLRGSSVSNISPIASLKNLKSLNL